MQWKDRSADVPISAKKPRKVKERQNGEREVRQKESGSGGENEEGNERKS